MSVDGQAQLVFRLYRPRDATLASHCVPQPAPADADALLSKFNALDVAAVDAELADESVQLSLAPKNPNWDLKRDLSKQLRVLEQQTQAAVIALMRDKLARQAGQLNADAVDESNDLNEAIDAQARRAEAGLDDDDDDDDDGGAD